MTEVGCEHQFCGGFNIEKEEEEEWREEEEQKEEEDSEI